MRNLMFMDMMYKVKKNVLLTCHSLVFQVCDYGVPAVCSPGKFVRVVVVVAHGASVDGDHVGSLGINHSTIDR